MLCEVVSPSVGLALLQREETPACTRLHPCSPLEWTSRIPQQPAPQPVLPRRFLSRHMPASAAWSNWRRLKMQAFGAVLVLKPARHPANAGRRRRQLQLWLHSPPAQLLVQRPAPHRLCRPCGAPLSCRMSSEQLQGQLPSCLCAGETRVSGPANATIINVQVMYGKRTHGSTHSSPSTAKTVTQRAPWPQPLPR